MSKKLSLVKDCAEAINAAQEISTISPEEMSKFMAATIDHADQEWWIASGPNMTFDHQGFGKTIKEAVNNYFDYIRKKN